MKSMEGTYTVGEETQAKVGASTANGEGQDCGPEEPRLCVTCGAPGALSLDAVSVEYGGSVWSVLSEWSECEECCRTRTLANFARLDAERRKEEADRWRERSLLGRRLESVSDSYQVTDANRAAYEVAMGWVQDPTSNLIIAGPIGCGKSSLAAHAFLRLHQAHRPAWWLSVPRLIDAIRGGYSNGAIAYESAELIDRAKRAPILFLDDLGKSHAQNTGWIEGELYTIIDHRYCEMLPTVATTEYTGEALCERVGESVVSRLRHGALVAGIKKPATPWRTPQ